MAERAVRLVAREQPLEPVDLLDQRRWQFNAMVAMRLTNRLMQSVGVNDPARYTVHAVDGELRVTDRFSQSVEGDHTYEAVVLLPEEHRLEFREWTRSGCMRRATLAGNVASWSCAVRQTACIGRFELVSLAGNRHLSIIVW